MSPVQVSLLGRTLRQDLLGVAVLVGQGQSKFAPRCPLASFFGAKVAGKTGRKGKVNVPPEIRLSLVGLVL